MFFMNLVLAAVANGQLQDSFYSPNQNVQEQQQDSTLNDLLFIMTDDGKFITNEGKDFYVVHFPNKTAHNLYNDLMTHIAHIYESPKEVTETVEDRVIVVNGKSNNVTKYKMIWDTGSTTDTDVDLMYRLEFDFQDGKIKVNAPTISRIYLNFLLGPLVHDASSLPKMKSDDAEAVRNISMYFKSLLTEIVYGNPEDENW